MALRPCATARVNAALVAARRPLSESELAAAVGMTPRQLDRTLAVLRRAGIAAVEPHKAAAGAVWRALAGDLVQRRSA